MSSFSSLSLSADASAMATSEARTFSGREGQSSARRTRSGPKFCARPALGEGRFRCFSVEFGGVEGNRPQAGVVDSNLWPVVMFASPWSSLEDVFSGGGRRTRTLDPLLKRQLLYRLSYAPVLFLYSRSTAPCPWGRPGSGSQTSMISWLFSLTLASTLPSCSLRMSWISSFRDVRSSSVSCESFLA